MFSATGLTKTTHYLALVAFQHVPEAHIANLPTPITNPSAVVLNRLWQPDQRDIVSISDVISAQRDDAPQRALAEDKHKLGSINAGRHLCDFDELFAQFVRIDRVR
jgi:hypothetical protein